MLVLPNSPNLVTNSTLATILLGNNYGTSFNAPRDSRHTIIRRNFLPYSQSFLRPLDSFALWLPVGINYKLIHTFNRIPYTRKPWIVTFESLLPRAIGFGSNPLKEMLRERLALNNCKRIIAMSDYAKLKFVHFNQDWDLLSDVLKKVEVIHPNVTIQSSKPKKYLGKQPLKLVFVGRDFARKGGIVALRLAKQAQKMRLPITVHLVSKMNYGSHVYTDCLDPSRYEEDLKLLALPNIVFHGKKSNQEVMELLSKSHFQLMATLDDTYGYSIIEGFSVATPAITTNVCALPEFVRHGENGYLLSLELNENRNWTNLSSRKNHDYWDILDSTYDKLVEQALQLIVGILAKPEHYEQLSAGALSQACNVHDSKKTGELLDDIYTKAIDEVT